MNNTYRNFPRQHSRVFGAFFGLAKIWKPKKYKNLLSYIDRNSKQSLITTEICAKVKTVQVTVFCIQS